MDTMSKAAAENGSEHTAELKLHGLGEELSDQMTARVGDKEYRITPWSSFVDPDRPRRYFIYKDEDSEVGPGTEVKRTVAGFKLKGPLYKLDPLPSAESLSERPLDLEKGPEFQWFRDIRDTAKPVDLSQKERPWVIVFMGCPGTGKTHFARRGSDAQHSELDNACRAQLEYMQHPDSTCNVPQFEDVFFKQIDDIVRFCACGEFEALWEKCSGIRDPDERYRNYWANKQHLFTRFALDKPSSKAESYEMAVGNEMVRLLTQPKSRYNIAMETTGIGAGLVKGGLTANHYAHYNKLVILVEIDDVEKAKAITHSRMIRELLTCTLHGGEQFGTYLDVIHKKARTTYNECVAFGKAKNCKLDEADTENCRLGKASSDEGRWFFHTVKQTWDLNEEVLQRISFFYKEDLLRSQLGSMQLDGYSSLHKDALEEAVNGHIYSRLKRLDSRGNGTVHRDDLMRVMTKLSDMLDEEFQDVLEGLGTHDEKYISIEKFLKWCIPKGLLPVAQENKYPGSNQFQDDNQAVTVGSDF